MAITIIGLGPGDAGLITRQAWHLLSSADSVYLRTRRHPAVGELPSQLELHSFDYVYDTAADFTGVYDEIAASILQFGQSEDIIYAVPGNPFVGEATVGAIVALAEENGVDVVVVAGLSFVEPVLAAMKVDALDGLQLLDGIAMADQRYPPLNTDVAVLLGQVYSQPLAAALKLSLMSLYGPHHEVSLIHAAGQSDELVERTSLYQIDRSAHLAHLSSLFIPPLPVKSDLTALAETVAVLRSPEGCPWDQEQTPRSMRAGFLEEAYEVMDALDLDDVENLKEELGDLLYHIVMQAQMAAEAGDFTLTDVVAGIETKLKRRHPHVWGEWQVDNTEQVLINWEQLKQAERDEASEEKRSVLDNLPVSFPALARSRKIQERVARLGFDWPDISGVYLKLYEELEELQAAETREEKVSELGDVLFSIVNVARWLGLDSEIVLREANSRFIARFRVVENNATRRDLSLSDLDINELEDLWQEAKATLALADDAGTVG